MNLVIMKRFVLILVTISLATPGVVIAKEKKSEKITSEAGLNIPSWGIAIDAIYDSRLDNLVPGYKIINIIVTNKSANIIYFDPKKDKWHVSDNLGKTKIAINHLRFEDEKLWANLPPGLKSQLEYPQAVRIGHSVKIDLFFPASYDLAGFREISWKSDHFKKEFNILTSMEKPLEWNPKEEPVQESPSYKKSMEKYEGKDETEEEAKEETEEEKPKFDPTLDDFSISTD